jgi:cysteinyl-tRNA synthetase
MGLRDGLRALRSEFIAAMEHDFNTAGALGKLFELVRDTNRFLDEVVAGRDASVLEEARVELTELAQLLGFFSAGLPRPAGDAAPDRVRALAEQRLEARAARDWARSDALRQEIAGLGWVVEDREAGYRLKPLS